MMVQSMKVVIVLSWLLLNDGSVNEGSYSLIMATVNPLTPKSHYSGFVIKFIIKIITRACLVL